MIFEDFNNKGNETEDNVKVKERREEELGKSLALKGRKQTEEYEKKQPVRNRTEERTLGRHKQLALLLFVNGLR